MLDLSFLPTGLVVLLFCGAAAVVWWAGRRLPEVAAAIGHRMHIGEAFAGMLFLGGITALPELATTSSAAASGAADLALGNVLGSTAFNILLLAVADAVLGRAALTSAIGRPATLLQGVLGMLLLAAVAAIIVSGEYDLGGFVGLGSTLLFGGCILAMWIAAQYASRPAWKVVDPLPDDLPEEIALQGLSHRQLALRLLLLAALILTAGVTLSQSGEAIATRTGLGESIVGLVLLAIATSLPELTAITSAIKGRFYELAVGDIFGANLFNVAMIFLIDMILPGEPLLGRASSFEIFAALLGLFLTGIFVIGLLERANRTVLRMGYDSVAVLILYGGGIAVLSGLS